MWIVVEMRDRRLGRGSICDRMGNSRPDLKMLSVWMPDLRAEMRRRTCLALEAPSYRLLLLTFLKCLL